MIASGKEENFINVKKCEQRKTGLQFKAISFLWALLILPAVLFAQDVTQKNDASPNKAFGPQIAIYSPVQNQKVSGFDVMMNGEVTDDGEVVSITINDHSLGASGSKIPFQKLISLKDGKNEIHIAATDNDGNKVERVLTVYREGFEDKAIHEMKTIKKNMSVVKRAKEKVVVLPVLHVKGIIVKRADFIKISSQPRGKTKPVKQTKEGSKNIARNPKSGKIILVKYNTLEKKSGSHIIIVTTISGSKQERNGSSSIPHVFVNSKPVYAKTSPVIKNGRTYVALESDLITKLGVNVVRDKRAGRQYVYFYSKGKMVKLSVQGMVRASGKTVVTTLSEPLEVRHGHVMLPFRAVCEGLGFNVQWNKQLHTTQLTKAGSAT